MDHAVGAGGELDEAAEVLDGDDLAGVDSADLDLCAERLDRSAGLGRLRGVRARDEDGAVLLDVDRGSGHLLDAADRLAARADELADLLRVDLDDRDARSKRRDVGAGLGDDLLHLGDDVEPADLRLLEDRLDLGDREAACLEVELDAGDALAGARHLEVHLAEEVFLADDVGDMRHLAVGVGEPTDRDAGAGVADRNTRVHEREAAAAHARHRRRTVRLGDVADETDGVGEVLARRQDAEERALCERAVADLATARAHDAAGFTRAERREVVVEVELLRVLGEEAVDDLLVLHGAEGAGDERLRLATLEERRAVGAREDLDRHVELADLVELAAVGADRVLRDQVVRDLLLEKTERFLGLLLLLLRLHVIGVRDAGRNGKVGLDDLALDRVDRVVALLLALDLARLDQAVVGRFLALLHDLVARRVELAHADGGGAALRAELLHQLEDGLDALVVAELDRGDHGGLRDLGGADFDHVDAVLVAGEHEIEVAELKLRLRRVEHEALALLGDDAADADGRDRAEVGGVRDVERGRRSGAREDIGIVLAVVRHDPRLELDLVAETLGEERTDRAIHHAHREDFLLVRLALALAEAAGELARCAGLLAVVAGEREEVDARAGVGADAGREDPGVGVAGDDGAAGELGHAARLEAERAPADDLLNDGDCHDLILLMPRQSRRFRAPCALSGMEGSLWRAALLDPAVGKRQHRRIAPRVRKGRGAE